ncbi:MAG: SRPBCC family protein [Bacteroidetes bacterium]|nr:SRPBCC family protein [Bacteroidota bacterium]
MPEIRIETLINAPIERCFDLSRSIDLHTISTDHTDERAIAGRTSGLIGLGEMVTWSAFHFGIRQQLTSRITSYSFPEAFTDEMVRGAFTYIRHDHLFSQQYDQTLMTDVFRFASPFGPLGWMADQLVLTSYLRRLLEKRNRVIKEYAESDRWMAVLH